MKKVLLGLLFVAATQLMVAQQFISFEESEGYVLGNIHGQNSWFTTGYNNGASNIENQVVTNEMAVGGTNSFKITQETQFGPQTNPIVGGFFPLTAAAEAVNFTVSFDVRFTQQSEEPESSVFLFRGVNIVGDAGNLVYYLAFFYDGSIGVASDPTQPALQMTTAMWAVDTWYRVKIKGEDENILYYINDELIFTGTQLSLTPTGMTRIDFLHNNNIGDAYIDRLAINNEDAVSINETAISTDGISVYPNPVTDVMHINSDSKVNAVSVYDLSGRRANVQLVNDMVDVRSLQNGTYIISIETANGKKSQTFIKK